MSSFSFPDAVIAVESWLDGAGSAFATKVARSQSAGTLEWNLDLKSLGYPAGFVRVVVGPLFPALPCELFVDPDLCLQLPHIEEDGRVCLGEASQPHDFNDPVGAVKLALERFKAELLELSSNKAWCEAQFHKERLSYWSRFCYLRQKSPRGRPRPRVSLASVPPVEAWAEGEVAAFIPKGSRHRRIRTQVITGNEANPAELAARHGFDNGTVVRGSALFIRLPIEFPWTPSTWPRTFLDLEMLVQSTTGGEKSVAAWLQSCGWHDKSPGATERLRKANLPEGTKPLVVVLCHGQEQYGYQISQSTVSLVTTPHAAPIKLVRIDPAWSLTRDRDLVAFTQRKQKTVLVLGAGSLGSPVIESLARSGIGTLHIVDSQLFEAPNISRHSLGMSSVLQGKATAIATRLQKEIPGLQIKGFGADARTWSAQHCQPGTYHLVLDLTAESAVRSFLAHTRNKLFGDTVVIHAWVEHFCAAFHVVATTTALPWPSDDPAGDQVNVADYSAASSRVQLPACSDGFHPYGSADIVQAAGFAAERILTVVDDGIAESTVWSFVRAQSFFDTLGMPIKTRKIVPNQGGPRDGVMLTRSMADVLKN